MRQSTRLRLVNVPVKLEPLLTAKGGSEKLTDEERKRLRGEEARAGMAFH
jgi:hypothetical protein